MGRPASLKIASFRGVELKIHLSLLIIVAYLVFVIAARFTQVTQNAGIKPEQLTLGDGLGPWVWGTVLAISLFLSVFIHEFGHVLAAQNMGVRVQNITCDCSA